MLEYRDIVVRRVAWASGRYPEGMVGSPTARYLVVGEQMGNPELVTQEVPFCGPGGCGPYLTRALHLAGFRERTLAWVNAIDLAGNPRGLPIRNALDQPWVARFALGKVAQKLHPEAVPIPHPAYWKRFHHAELEVYVAMFKEHRIT